MKHSAINLTSRIVAFILILTLVFSAFSLSVFAEEIHQSSFESLRSQDYVGQAEEVTPTITISQTTASLFVGQTLQLTATVSPSDSAVNWSSSNTDIATVDASGLVTAMTVGTTTITVSVDSVTASCQLAVVSGGITVAYPTDNVLVGDTIQLSYSTEPSGRMVSWSSSNTDVATVDANGLVTFKLAGSVTITASAEGLISRTVTLYGTIEDGIYNLQSAGSHLYAAMNDDHLFRAQDDIFQDGNSLPTDTVSLMWRLHYIGNGKYTIRSYANPARAIGVMNGKAYVSDDILNSDQLDENRTVTQWTVTQKEDSYYILTNVSTGKVLSLPVGDTNDGTGLTLNDEAGTTSNLERRWVFKAIPDSSIPKGLFLYIYQESLDQWTPFSEMSLNLVVGDSRSIRAIYRDPDDISQSFIWTSSDSKIATYGDYQVKALDYGTSSFSVEHNSSETILPLSVSVRYEDDFRNVLIEQYGFSANISGLIRKTYDKIIEKYPNEDVLEIAWKYSRLLSGLTYNNWKFNDVAGNPIDSYETYSEYFVNFLNFSADEFNLLNGALNEQHRIAIQNHYGDFTHCMYSLSARLAYLLDKDGFLSNLGTMKSDEEISYLAGWFGDATLTGDNGYTSFGNDDYIADLDAENMYRILESDKTDFISMMVSYQQIINSKTQTRAEIFLSHLSYETVRSMVLKELVKKISMSLEQKMDYLKTNQPDTYNFLMSLSDNLNEMGNYIG